MKKVVSLLGKDIRLGFKDIFILLEIIFAVIFSALLVFVIPEDIRTTGKVYIWDQTKLVENFVMKYNPEIGEQQGEYYVESRQELIDGITEDKSAVGLIIREAQIGGYEIELLTQPYTKAGTIDYIETDLEDLMMILDPPQGRYPPDVYNSVRIETSKFEDHEIIPFNKKMLPSMLMLNVGLIGLFAMVSLIGQERMDMTIRAYRLSPASMLSFITSKHIMLIIVSLICFTLMYIPLMGLDGYGISLAVMMLTALTMSSAGIILASFYKTPMEAMGWVFILMLILALPAVSLLNPLFSPDWIKGIPSFHTLFALDAAMFPDGNADVIRRGIIVLAVFAAASVPLSTAIFTIRVGREG